MCKCVKLNHLALQQKLTHHCESATHFNQKQKKKPAALIPGPSAMPLSLRQCLLISPTGATFPTCELHAALP